MRKQHDFTATASKNNADLTSHMSKSRKNTQEMHESAPAFAGRPIRRLVRWDELQETRHLARAPDELDGLLDKDEHS
jgi:hypothetical protein